MNPLHGSPPSTTAMFTLIIESSHLHSWKVVRCDMNTQFYCLCVPHDDRNAQNIPKTIRLLQPGIMIEVPQSWSV